MQHDILTGKIIRCAMNVHKALRNGFQEVIYQRALEIDLSQAMNYLEAYKMEIGLLINFGSKSLEFKRIHNNRLNNQENPLIK